MIITATVVTARVDNLRFDAFVHDPAGPIRRDLTRRAVAVQAFMTRGCPRRTELLVSTIRKNNGHSPRGPEIDVLCGRDGITDYLGYVLAGTAPHLILPHGRALRFMVGGAVVFATAVFHPGTSPNNFMLRALPEAIR
jgi:hypothetical protein